MLENSLKAEIKREIFNKFSKIFANPETFKDNLKVERKEDRSVVTEVDLFISKLIEEKVAKKIYPNYTFFSEENFKELTFPAIILDPIDGTKELTQGIAECALSLAIITNEKKYGWIYNPFTGFEIASDSIFFPAINSFPGKLTGAVSRSEWKKELFKNYNQELVTLFPKGSIAYKLGLLSSGAFDFIVSKYSKNIWDIAAGTILAKSRGFSLFEQDHEVLELNKKEYFPPLVWCKKEHFKEIKQATLHLGT